MFNFIVIVAMNIYLIAGLCPCYVNKHDSHEGIPPQLTWNVVVIRVCNVSANLCYKLGGTIFSGWI